MKKRVLSMFMALALCLTLLPTAALAEENTTEPSTQLTEPTPVPQEPKTPDQGENTETPDQPEEPSQDEPPAADEPPAVQSEPAPQAAVQAAEVPAENAVAQVGNVNYANITDAFAAVKKNGGTLTLLADCETSNTSDKFDISGNYTLDLNGCTLKGRLYLSKTSTSLTVKDSGTGGRIQATAGWSPLWVDGGDVTIESGTLATQNENAQALVFGDNDACKTLTITGGSFETGYVNIGASGGKTVISGGAFHELRVNGDSKRVTLSGGTFDTVKRRKSGSTIAPADLLADGYAFVDRDTGAEVSTSQEAALTNVKVVSEKTANASASLTVNGTETPYGTFEEALTAAQQTPGGTLTLLNNVNLVTQVYVNSGTFTLDLNGHTLTSGDYNTLVVGDGSVTIQDSKVGGVISNTRSDGIAVYCYGGNVTILSGSITSKLFWESGTVSLQGGAFRSLNRTDGSWLSAIPEGKALERNGQITDASAKELITEDGFYVLADHEHDWQAGRCACGREHTDHTWEDGKCTVCHLICSHEIGEDGVCQTCGTQFAVRDDDGNYYKHLADALAIESVDDVTLVADDTLSEDVTLIKDIFFYPNGHTVSGGGAIVVPSGKRLVLGEKDETEKAGNAGAILVENGGTLMVDEGFTGTVQTLTVSETADVKLSGGTYRTITGSRQKAGTLLNYNTATGEKYFAFQKQDGTFARYDQRIPSETPLENVTVVGCPDKQLTEACGETCEYCGGALRCRIGAAGYRNMSDAIRDVPDGGTITLLRDYSAVTNISANVDRAYTIDLNGHSVRKDNGGISLAVYAGTPKIIDSKGGGVIAGLEIDSELGLTLADLLPKGWDFQKSDGNWLSTTELKGKTASNVTVAQLPIQSMKYPTEMSMTYGGTGTLIVNVKGTGAVTFQWYKVEDGNEKAVGSETTKNQFDFSALKLPAGKHIFRFSATCNGYKKMSQDIVVTVQKADIRSGLITPPTAQENLTYTGQEQELITAGSVTSGGTMQYSLTENGTYSQDTPTGTDAGAYTVWYRVIGDANHNDTAPASVAVRIGKKPLTISGVTVAPKPYDGTTNADISSVTFDGVTLNRGTDYTVTASFDDAGVGDGKSVTATVTLMGQAAKNYALEQSSFPTTGSITKAAAPDFTKETALVIINGYEKTYTVTLPTLPTLETHKEYGTLTYEIGEIKLNDGYYTSGAKVENGELTLPIQKNDVKTTGSVGTATVVIKSTNYEDITLTVKVNAANKIEPTPDGEITATPITYGDTLSNSKISGKMKDPDTGIEVKGTFAWPYPNDKPKQTGDYKISWIFTPDESYGGIYAAVTDPVKVHVAPKSIEGATITLEKDEFAYKAAEQSPKITRVTLEGWSETITYRIVSGDKATNANDSIPLTIEGTGNYTGTATVEWKITPKTVTPTIEVASCTYTGDALKPTVTVKDDIGNIIDQKEYEIFYSNNTNAGTATVTIKDADGGNYVLSEASKTFEITKAAAPTAAAGSLTITNGLHKTYSLDLSTLLPKLTAPCDYGTIAYDKKVDTTLGSGTFVTLVNGKTGELTLDANRSATDEGQFGAITVTISTSNYQDITLTIHVSAKNRITPTGTPTLSKNAITYGNALNTIALSGKLHDNVNNVDVDGTFEWVDGTHIPVVGNGTYAAEWIFEPTDTEKYLTVSGRSNITVEKAQQYGKVSMAGYTYGQAPSTPTLTDRTGDANAQVTYYYSSVGNGNMQVWSINDPPALNAGTYRMSAKIGETNNYYEYNAEFCEFVVAKATPTYTAPTGLTAKYGQTLADVTLPDGWSWTDSSESVGGASTAAKTFQAKFTPKDTENYNTVENIELEVMVNKVDGRNLKTVELEQKYTDTSEHTYTPDWAGLPAGQDWTFSSEATIVLPKQDFAADGSLLTYAISGGKAGDKITITLKASCDNYEDFTITLNVTLTEKDDQKSLTITGGTTVVYGQTLQLGTTGGSGTGAVTYAVTNGTGEATIDATGKLTPVKVGTVKVKVTKAADASFNEATSTEVEITITRATPTGAPKYTAITTSGKTLADAGLTVTGSTLNPNAGTLVWVDNAGNVLPGTTAVAANTTYKWLFTPTDANYTTLTGSIELYHKSSSSGGWYYTYYTIKATAGTNGSISPSGWTSVRDGWDQTFTITPDKGYAVAKVLVDGKSVGAVKSYTFKNVTKDHTIEAIFMKSNGNPQTGVFVDVAEGSYYEEAIDWAVEKGVTNGVSSNMFAPNDPCTRAQIVTFLWRAAGSPAPKSMSSFTDVPADAFYAKAVAWAVENGITSGTGEGKFSPNSTCTRAQAVTFLYRASGSPAVSGSAEFSDVATNAYYADAVAWAAKKGITTGIGGGLFGSDNDCTRGQIVTFLWRAMAE